MLAIQKKLSSTNTHPNQNSKEYIIIHETDNTSKGAGANTHRNAQANGNLPGKASVHYYVDDSNIVQVVNHDDGTNNCGDGNNKYGINNRNTISIEICVNSDSNYEIARNNAIDLVAYLKGLYPNAKIVRHYDASRKYCPRKIQDAGYWDIFLSKVNERLGIKADAIISTNTPTTDLISKGKEYVGDRCKELQEKLIKLGYNCGGYGADGSFGQGTYKSLIQFQRDNGLVVDGLAGTNTFAKLNELIAGKTVSTGDDWVRRLQQECNRQGFSNQKVDGIAGPATLAGCPVLRKGAAGAITKLLQEKLDISVDGIFGANTQAAVINYQKSKGLSADGVVGQNTWRKLLNL